MPITFPVGCFSSSGTLLSFTSESYDDRMGENWEYVIENFRLALKRFMVHFNQTYIKGPCTPCFCVCNPFGFTCFQWCMADIGTNQRKSTQTLCVHKPLVNLPLFSHYHHPFLHRQPMQEMKGRTTETLVKAQ